MSHHEYNEHHHPPSSRGGTQTTELPKEFHQAWHVVFQNLKEDELLVFVKDVQELVKQKDKVKAKELHNLRQEIKECDNVEA